MQPASFGKRGAARPAALALQPVPDQSAAASPARPWSFPRLTCVLLILLVAIFVAELAFGVDPAASLAPSHRTIIALGGLSGTLFHAGEWWRIFTAPLLHANLLHLV